MKLLLLLIGLCLGTQSFAQVLEEKGEMTFSMNAASEVLVTGGTAYPLDVIKGNLGLTESDVVIFRGRRVVSVGEGYNELLPHLLAKGVAAYGMDTWYNEKNFPNNKTGARMRDFARKHRKNLIAASCLDIPNKYHGKFELVLLHQLLGNLTRAEQASCVVQSMKLLQPEGEAIFACIDRDTRDALASLLRRLYPNAQVMSFQEGEVTYAVKNLEPYVRRKTITIPDCYRLVVKTSSRVADSSVASRSSEGT